MDSGDMALEFTSCFTFLPPMFFFFPPSLFKIKKKSVVVENKD